MESDTKRIDETSVRIVDHVALALETLLNNTELDKVARWVIEALACRSFNLLLTEDLEVVPQYGIAYHARVLTATT